MNLDEPNQSAIGKTRKPIMRFAHSAAIFFRGFLDHPRMVASIVPSSKSMIDALLERVDWESCSLFVEYGPGVGTFTSHILDRLPADGKLLVIDTNSRFIDYLRQSIQDDRFQAVLGSAADVEKFIQATGRAKADYILSGLPFSALSVEQGQEIVDTSYSVLREGGAFLTYQFSYAARRLTAQRFGKVESGFALLNVPPCLLTWGWKLSQR